MTIWLMLIICNVWLKAEIIGVGPLVWKITSSQERSKNRFWKACPIHKFFIDKNWSQKLILSSWELTRARDRHPTAMGLVHCFSVSTGLLQSLLHMLSLSAADDGGSLGMTKMTKKGRHSADEGNSSRVERRTKKRSHVSFSCLVRRKIIKAEEK